MTEDVNEKTIELRDIDTATFENYFMPNTPGWTLASEAHAAGEVTSALDALEVVCLVNQLYMVNLQTRVIEELAVFGADKVEQYASLDSSAYGDFLAPIIGIDRVALLLKEVLEATRSEVATRRSHSRFT